MTALPALLAIGLALALAGCDYEVVNWEINSLATQCEKHGGIARIDTRIKTSAECADGAIVFVARGKS